MCDEARIALQQVLEIRARRGDPVPRVRYIDIASKAELENAYGARIPVLAVNGSELALTASERGIGQFLDRTLGRLA